MENLKERVEDANLAFLKMSDSFPPDHAHGKLFIDQIRQLEAHYLHRQEPLSLLEYIDIKRQLQPIAFLLEQCKALRKGGATIDQRMFDRITLAKTEADELLHAIENKQPEFQKADLYEAQEKAALLDAQWESEIEAKQLTRSEQRNLYLILVGILNLKDARTTYRDVSQYLADRYKIVPAPVPKAGVFSDHAGKQAKTIRDTFKANTNLSTKIEIPKTYTLRGLVRGDKRYVKTDRFFRNILDSS